MKHEGGNITLWGAFIFIHRVLDDCNILKGGWMGSCIARFWPLIFEDGWCLGLPAGQ